MNLQKLFTKTPQVASDRYWLTMLAKHNQIDLGYISSISNDGKTAVVTVYDVADKQYTCEVIGIGNSAGTLQPALPGQSVLVFFPRSPLTLDTTELDIQQASFSKSYAKCLPIGLNGAGSVQLATAGDSINITSDNYSCSFSEQGVQIKDKDTSVIIDAVNNIVSIVENSTAVNITPTKTEVIIQGTYDAKGALTDSKAQVTLDTNGVTIKAANMRLDGDVEITGNLKAGNGNFEANK